MARVTRRAKGELLACVDSAFSAFPGLSASPDPVDISTCEQGYKIDSIIAKKNTHAVCHIGGRLGCLAHQLEPARSREIFDFAKKIRSVNQIKNTLLKMKQGQSAQLKRQFDPNSIDERVRDFFFDAENGVFYVTLLCGQIFIFDRKLEDEAEPGRDLRFQISKKVTLKQKILKMEKIKGFRKELVIPDELSQKFEDQLEALTTTTTGTRTISLVPSKRSSSLSKMSHSQTSGHIQQIHSRSRSSKRYIGVSAGLTPDTSTSITPRRCGCRSTTPCRGCCRWETR